MLQDKSGFHKEAVEQKDIPTSQENGNPDIGRSNSLLNRKDDQRLKDRFDPRRRRIEGLSNQESKDNNVRPSSKQNETIPVNTTKDTLVNKNTEQGIKKNNQAPILSTKGKLSTSRRRGQIPQSKTNYPEYPLRKEQESKRPETTEARRVNHRFRQ